MDCLKDNRATIRSSHCNLEVLSTQLTIVCRIATDDLLLHSQESDKRQLYQGSNSHCGSSNYRVLLIQFPLPNFALAEKGEKPVEFKATCVIALAVAFRALPMVAQEVSTVNLSSPITTFSYGFTNISGIRELSSGTVIVLDAGESVLYVIESNWETFHQIGREGAGPGEYRNPSKLFALPRDSSAALDEFNVRMLVITPEARPGDFLNPSGQAGTGESGHETIRYSLFGGRLLPAQASDGRGFFYAQGHNVVPNDDGVLVPADSAALERWTIESPKRDTVGFIPVEIKPGSRVFQGQVGRPVPRRPRAFVEIAQWDVSPDGRVAVVTHNPYRVTFYSTDGEIVVGPPIDYERIRVSRDHKREWREERQETRVALVIDSDGQRGAVNFTPRVVEP